ncbi:MAG: Ig-like domain-containing protein [Pseudomonadota bacterium]|nr:Ig-like domain-containing protein [Pseudomonadota bacterium]
MLLALVTSSLVALVSPASAEPSADLAAAPESCAQTRVWVTSPAPLATDVPVDALPAGLVTEGSCGAAAWTGTLIDAATGATVVSVTHVITDGQLIEVDPGADLAPNTTYTLRFEPTDGGGELTEIGFTTGSSAAVGLDGGPTVESALATWSTSGFLSLQAEVGVAGSADGASIVTFAIEGEEDLEWTSADGPTTIQLFAPSLVMAEAPDEVCIVARQRDIAGLWSESPSDCVAPEIVRERSGGCFNATRGAPTGGLLGLLLAVSLARRKGR